MVLRTGVDLIEISRIADVVSRHGKHFLKRVYTSSELDLYGKRIESLASRFAAKEAVAKALGCGIGDVTWKEIEVLEDDQRAPVLNLYGQAAQMTDELGLKDWSVSLSHSQSHALAFVVAIG